MSVIDATYDEQSGNYKIATLTGKQEAFVYYYCGEARSNATKAARLAGYSGDDETLAVCGSQLIRNPKVNACIAERMRELSATQAEVTMRLTKWIRDEASPMERAAQVKAAEVLARIHGMIIDKQQREEHGEVKITIHHTNNKEEEKKKIKG